MFLGRFLWLRQVSRNLFLTLWARIDDRPAYKQKFDSGSLEREPREFWHGVRARLDGKSREVCPYRFEKAESWRKGFDGRN